MRYGFHFASVCTSESWNPLDWEALGSGSPTTDPAVPAPSLILSTTFAWLGNPSRNCDLWEFSLEICTCVCLGAGLGCETPRGGGCDLDFMLRMVWMP